MISVIVPTIGRPEALATMIASLQGQLADEDEVIVVSDPRRYGPGWARNQGVAQSRGDVLLFSDDDVIWVPGAVAMLQAALQRPSSQPGWRVGYAYGGYRLLDAPAGVDPGPFAMQRWSLPQLRRTNTIPTMALVDREVFPGFDESLPMLEDYDLWLTLAELGVMGRHVRRILFTTPYRADGITYGKMAQCAEVKAHIQKKHHVLRPDPVATA